MNSALLRRLVVCGKASNALVIAIVLASISVHSACWTGDDDIANGDDDDTTADDDDVTDDDDDDTVGDDDTAEDADGDGWTVGDGDCDDLDPYVHPEAADLCDGVDAIVTVWWTMDVSRARRGSRTTSRRSSRPFRGARLWL